MKLIIGLGNPEERYRDTRHNVGFRILTAFANEQSATFQLRDKFHACVAQISDSDEKIILAKPTTYYNNVGQTARAISDFYKITDEDVLVIHDELALPFGTIRTRIGGSDAGNNGVKSINDHIGQGTARLRVGIYNDLRDRIDDADFVLGNWTHDEAKQLTAITEVCCQHIDAFIKGTFVVTSVR